MTKVFNRAIKIGGHERLINDVTVQVLEYDGDSKILLCTGVTVPTADSSGFAKGCLFIKTDAADGTKGLYENQGTTSASDFNLVGAVAVGEITLAQGSTLIGNASGVGVAIDLKGDGKILVGNGTTATSVAVSGDVTLSNAGVVTIGAGAVESSMLAASSDFGLGVLRVARAKYDFAVDGGAQGAIVLATTATLPDNAVVVGGTINATTAGGSGGAATIAVGFTAGGAADTILTATAVASFSTDALLNSAIVFATPYKMTAAGNINITVATADLNAGVIEITLYYYVAAA